MQVLGIIGLVLVCVVITVAVIFLVTGLMGAPYVPTIRQDFDKTLDKLYKLTEKDLLVDLGAGDGVILELAEKRGARALGIEVNPILALAMRWKFRKNPRVEIKQKNFYRARFPEETTVVYAFAVGLHIQPIYRKIRREATRLNKPIYFISNAFDLSEVKPEKKMRSWYLYKVAPEKKSEKPGTQPEKDSEAEKRPSSGVNPSRKQGK